MKRVNHGMEERLQHNRRSVDPKGGRHLVMSQWPHKKQVKRVGLLTPSLDQRSN